MVGYEHCCGLRRVGLGWHLLDLLTATTRQPGGHRHDARAGFVEGCPGLPCGRVGTVDETLQLSVQDLSMIPAHDRSAGTLAVNNRAEVRTRGGWESRSRVLIRPVPSNPLD